jgi:hypothetical protein
MQKEEENKTSKVEENYFFPPQDGFPEFSCQAASLEEAGEKYKAFKENKK